jgi:hypothetical protein
MSASLDVIVASETLIWVGAQVAGGQSHTDLTNAPRGASGRRAPLCRSHASCRDAPFLHFSAWPMSLSCRQIQAELQLYGKSALIPARIARLPRAEGIKMGQLVDGHWQEGGVGSPTAVRRR